MMEMWGFWTTFLCFCLPSIFCTGELGFSGNESVEVKVMLTENRVQSFILELSFRSYKTDGLLLVHNSSTSDFYTVSVKDKHVVFWMQSSGKLLKVRSIHPLEYDRWNNVTLTRTKLLISMELNKNPVIESAEIFTGSSEQWIMLGGSLFLGGYPTYPGLINNAPTVLPFSGCIRNLTFQRAAWVKTAYKYSLWQDTTLVNQVQSGLIKNCSTTQLCEYLISIRNMEARKAHLCHWNETQVVISSHVSSSCPSASPAISYQWTVYYLYGKLTTISTNSSRNVLRTTPMNLPTMTLNVAPFSADIPMGVYGVNLTVELSTLQENKSFTQLGYFVVGCKDVQSQTDADCEWLQKVIFLDIKLPTELKNTNHCLQIPPITSNGTILDTTAFWELEKEARNITANAQHLAIFHPQLQLVCVRGCGAKVGGGQVLTLQTQCKSCETHTWSLLACDPLCSTEISLPQSLRNDSMFSFSVNGSFVSQQVVYTGTYLSGRNVTAGYNLTVNQPPRVGNCSITPQSGLTLLTGFNVSCQGFSDPDSPLLYILSQVQTSGKKTQLMKSEKASISSLYLNEGSPESNYTLSLTVECQDSLGLTSPPIPLTVQVLPLSSGSDVMDVISGNILGNATSTGIISDLIAAGKQTAVTQILQTSVLALNNDVAANESDVERQNQRKEIREAVVAILANSSTGTQDLEMVTSVLNSATEFQEELSPETQEQAAVLYEGMSSAFSQQSVNGSQTDAETTAGLLLEGVTMLLDTRTIYGSRALHLAPTNHTLQTEVKSAAERLLGTVDVITDMMMNYLTPDTPPAVFTTRKMNLALSKSSPTHTTGKSLSLDKGENSGNFTIPADGKLSTLLSNTSFTTIQVMLTEKNPYIWDLASDNLTTPMVSLTLRDDLHQRVNVTGLTDPVQIYISNFNPKVQKTEENFTLNVVNLDSFNASMSDDLCRIMKFNSTEGRSTILTILPLTLNLSISVMEIQNVTDISHQNITSNGRSLNSSNNFTYIFTSLPTGVITLGFCIDQTVDNFLQLNQKCLTLTSCRVTLETQLYSAECMYWNVTKDMWSSSGCQVGPQTSPALVHCECTHLTAFSGSFFVAPNFVDPFADAALFLTFFSNPVVVSCVILIWLVYFTLLTWATKQDRLDKYRGGVTIAHENRPDHDYSYLVCVITGWWKDAGTTANVSLSFSGTRGHSARHCLSESVPGKQCFLAGYEDWFLVTTPQSLGELRSLSVWHDNKGKSPHWYLSRVLIEDLRTQRTWTFLYSDWVAVDRGSVSLKLTLQPCSLEDLTGHTNQQFLFKSSRDLRESHLWLSIASKPSYSSFTRVQRLSCALCLLLMTMLTSLMFHGIPTDDPADQAQVGRLTLSLSDLVIGVQSGLIMFPVNILIIQLFLKAKRRPRGATPVTAESKKKTEKKSKKSERKYSVDSLEKGEEDEKDDTSADEEEEREVAKEDGILPWWTVYIAWTLVLSISLVSSYFVMLYGLKFGYQKSVDWLVSFFTAFFQSALVTQPLKVIAISLVFTMILKRPVLVQGGKASTEKMSKQIEVMDNRQGHYVPDPLSRRLMNKIRQKLKLEEEIHVTLRDMALYAVFVICILFMAHGHRTVRKSLMVQQFMENTFIDPRHPPIYSQGSGYSTDILELQNVVNVELFWSYIKERIIPVLGEMSLGNRTQLGLVSEYFLLGKYRIRQIRIKEDSCDFPNDPRMKSMIPGLNCSGKYWMGNEDNQDYNLTWTKPLPQKLKQIPDTWSHRSSWSLKTLPYEGMLSTYSGGGYTVLLDGNVTQSLAVIQDLQDSSWIDYRTRAVFVEFTSYNANIKMFCVVMIVFEFSNLGALFPAYQVFTTKYFNYGSSLEMFTAFCEILFVIFALCFFYLEIKRLYYGGRAKYFRDPWSYIEIIQIILSFSIVGLNLKRIVSVSSKLTSLRSTDEFVSFYTSIFWDMTLNYVLAFFVFLVILKFFKLLKFNIRMYFLSQTLSIAKKNLLGFALIVVIVVVAFAHFAMLTFGTVLQGFAGMGESLITLFRLALGESDFPSLKLANSYLGPIFFFLYIFMVQWTVLVMFMAILNLAIEETKENMSQMKNDLEVVDYIYNRLHQLLPKCH
uniref:Polycystic kidney disease protein 1-like 2 isoform X2 n=1 Tax=Crassostrea virginica TaxID=6565 RepID=A0A8B8DUG1_CRAVI|nr:polycystic kidney disease protein 1-like 2 isoform X2 [Crassostrea virginica]